MTCWLKQLSSCGYSTFSASINKLPRDEVDSILGQSRVGDKLESSESSRKMQKENMLLNTRVLELQSVLEKTMNEGKKHVGEIIFGVKKHSGLESFLDSIGQNRRKLMFSF